MLADYSCGSGLSLLLWVVAAVLVFAGIFRLIAGAVLGGVLLILVALLIGPGGVSIFC